MTTNKLFNKIEECLCCGTQSLEKILDLNSQPLANSYPKVQDSIEKYYPLDINYCTNCTHTQLTHEVDPKELFEDYVYVSGTTKTLLNYFDWFVDFVEEYIKGKTILDIACNDGSQLNSFKNKGYETFGIDPAKNLFELSSKNHNIICDFLNENSSQKIGKKIDVIIAQNVFAHNAYPFDFLNHCKDIVSDTGYIFIQTSQCDMILNNQFDTIYHEHISFFSVKSFSTLCNRVGLNLIDVKRTDIHGTSFVFVISKSGVDNSEILISKEKPLSLELMINYSNKCKDISVETKNKVNELKDCGFKVVGYGAAAKGNTFLNFSGFTLDYIIDDNKLKIGSYTPGSKIPIVSSDILLTETHEKLCIVILAWNFSEEIKQRVLDKKSNVFFLNYFPQVKLS